MSTALLLAASLLLGPQNPAPGTSRPLPAPVVSLNAIKAQMQSPRLAARLQAVRALYKRLQAYPITARDRLRTSELLLSLLEDPNLSVRRLALRAALRADIGKRGMDVPLTPSIRRRYLESRSAEAQEFAIVALGLGDRRDAADKARLASLLKSPHATVRAAALGASLFSLSGNAPELEKMLRPLLSDPDPTVRGEAARAYLTYVPDGQTLALPLVEQGLKSDLASERARSAAALRDPLLVATLRRAPSAAIGLPPAQTLPYSKAQAEKWISTLLPLTRDKDAAVRRSATETLSSAWTDNPAIVEAMTERLGDDDARTRKAAAQYFAPGYLLYYLYLREMVPERPGDRRAAASALLRLAAGSAAAPPPVKDPELGTVVQDSSADAAQARDLALQALGTLDPDAPTLEALFGLIDQTASGSFGAFNSLALISERHPEVVPRLLVRLPSLPEKTRAGSFALLLWLHRDHAPEFAALTEYWAAQPLPFRQASLAVGVYGPGKLTMTAPGAEGRPVPTDPETPLVRDWLIGLLGDKDPLVRAAAATGLGQAFVRDDRVLNGLLPLLDDPNPDVRQAALRSLTAALQILVAASVTSTDDQWKQIVAWVDAWGRKLDALPPAAKKTEGFDELTAAAQAFGKNFGDRSKAVQTIVPPLPSATPAKP